MQLMQKNDTSQHTLNVALRQQLKLMQLSHKAALEESRTLREESQSVRNENEVLRKECQDLRNECQGLRQENQGLRDEFQGQRGRNEMLRSNLLVLHRTAVQEVQRRDMELVDLRAE